MDNNGKLTGILLDLHRSRRTGILRIERAKEKKQLVLINGLLAFAESNLPEEHLAKIMTRQNLLPASKLKEITALMKEGNTSEEAILALPNANVADVEKGRREQAISILASFWTWTTFALHFYAGNELVRHKVNLAVSLPEMVVLSARHAVSARLIAMPGNFALGTWAVAKEVTGKASELPLMDIESSILSMLQEPMSTADLLAQIPVTTGKTEECLLCLSALGLIELQESIKQPESDSMAEAAIQPLDDMLMRMESANYYEILTVSQQAGTEEIQAAYHDLAKQFHPDRFQSNEFTADIHGKAQQVFASINEAYFALKNSDSREAYDAKLLVRASKADTDSKAKAAVDQQTAETLFQAGRVLILRGEFERAIERLKGCVWLRPENARYHHFLAVAQANISQYRKEAEQHFLKAIELDAMSTESRLALARLYVQVQLRRKAEVQLQELLRWDPEHREALKILGELANSHL